MHRKTLFFGNIFVNSKENYLRMRDSFEKIDNSLFSNFVLNIRGEYKNNAIQYFNSKKINLTFSLSSNYGWFHDTFMLVNKLKYDYIFCWLEDQICLDNHNFKNFIDLSYKNDLDIVGYVYNGDDLMTQNKISQNNLLNYLSVDKNNYHKKCHDSYIISYGSLIKKELFLKVILDNDSGIWDKKTPFGFEKDSSQLKWLPLKIAVLNKEIFASIDDDHYVKGSSLHSRGLYPIRGAVRKDTSHLRKYIQSGKKYWLSQSLKRIFKCITLFTYFFTFRININLAIRCLNYLITNKLNDTNIKVVSIIGSYKFKKVSIITIDDELVDMKTLFPEKCFNIITNNLFDVNTESILGAVPYKTSNIKNKPLDKVIHNGYQINFDFKKIKNDQLIIAHSTIYENFIRDRIIFNDVIKVDSFYIFFNK